MKYDLYDLVITGTGFASTFFLRKYLDKAPASAKVLVLERGHLYPHSERLKQVRGEETPFANLNPHFKDTFLNKSPEKQWIFQTAFGGNSNCWYGCTPRFLPSDFRMNTLYGVANDWPLQYEDLEPFYTEAEEIMSISGPESTPFPNPKIIRYLRICLQKLIRFCTGSMAIYTSANPQPGQAGR